MERWILAVGLLSVLALIWAWSLCMAIKQDRLEAQRDRLGYGRGCDDIDLRHAGREGRDA